MLTGVDFTPEGLTFEVSRWLYQDPARNDAMIITARKIAYEDFFMSGYLSAEREYYNVFLLANDLIMATPAYRRQARTM